VAANKFRPNKDNARFLRPVKGVEEMGIARLSVPLGGGSLRS
jgi:hypothetical protein